MTGGFAVKPMDPETLKHAISDYILSLPDSAFKSPAAQRMNAIHNQIVALDEMFDSGSYHGAMQKLQYDVRAKADGSVDDNPNNDWITDPVAQQKICAMIDELIALLQTLY